MVAPLLRGSWDVDHSNDSEIGSCKIRVIDPNPTGHYWGSNFEARINEPTAYCYWMRRQPAALKLFAREPGARAAATISAVQSQKFGVRGFGSWESDVW